MYFFCDLPVLERQHFCWKYVLFLVHGVKAYVSFTMSWCSTCSVGCVGIWSWGISWGVEWTFAPRRQCNTNNGGSMPFVKQALLLLHFVLIMFVKCLGKMICCLRVTGIKISFSQTTYLSYRSHEPKTKFPPHCFTQFPVDLWVTLTSTLHLKH
jgi:hypothetical protein